VKYRITLGLILASALATSVASAQASNSSGGDDEEQQDKPKKKVQSQQTVIGVSPDRAQVEEKKFDWSVGAVLESQAFLVQNDLGGAAPDKFFNYYGVFGRIDVLKYNRFTFATGIYQRFTADPGESGVRMDDSAISYARIIPLPDKYRLILRAAAIFPTSFYSQKMGLITAGRATVWLDKTYGKYFYANLRGFMDGYAQQYTSMEGGNPNPVARLGGIAEATVSMPFHPNLGLGAALYTAYSWYYDANAKPPPLTGYPDNGMPQVQEDRQFTHQPTRQTYGWEIYLRYYLPPLFPRMNSNLEFGLASGDGLTGYTSRTHDGVSHLYLLWRQTARVYLALTATF